MRLVTGVRTEDPQLSPNASVGRVGGRVGVNVDSCGGWCQRADIDSGGRAGRPPMRRSKVSRTRSLSLNAATKSSWRPQASSCGTSTGDCRGDRVHRRPQSQFGVAPICTVLGCTIAPSTYYAAKNRAPSARAARDLELVT